MNEPKTTDTLTNVLLGTSPESAGKVLQDEAASMFTSDRPFSAFLRERLKDKGLRQQDLFVAADIPERYGYKLISGEKHTVKRDVILRLLFAAALRLDDAQRALKLYGFSPLYARIPRDAVLMIAFNSGIREIDRVNELLEEHGMAPLESCGEE